MARQTTHTTTTPTTIADRPNFYPVLPKHTREVNDTRYREEVCKAVDHLKLIARQHREITLINSDGSLNGFIFASQEVMRTLVLNDPAYRDAAAILYTGMVQSISN